MHIPHNILYLKVSYISKNAIPNIYSILIKGLILPSSFILLFNLATWPVWRNKNVKTNSIRTMLFILFRNWGKIIFPHSAVTWFHSNSHQMEDILVYRHWGFQMHSHHPPVWSGLVGGARSSQERAPMSATLLNHNCPLKAQFHELASISLWPLFLYGFLTSLLL